MLRRGLYFFLLLSMFAMLISETVMAKTTTLEFWTISLSPWFDNYIKNTISAYEKANPGIKVVWKDIPIDAIQQKLLAAIAGGVAPDVVNLNTPFAFQMAEKGALVDLDKAASKEMKSIYYEGLWESTRYKGGVYAFPWYVATSVLMINTDLVKKAGLDPNKPPETWEDLYKWGRVFKTKLPNVYALHRYFSLIVDFPLNGIPLVDESRKKAAFNTPEAIKLLKEYRQLYVEGLTPPETLKEQYSGALNRYQAGTLATVFTGPQFLNRIRQDAPDVYKATIVAPAPKSKTGIVAADVMNLAVPKASKHVEEAVKFANYFTNDHNQLEFCKVAVILPSTKKASQDPYFTSQLNTLEGKARYIGLQQLKNAVDMNLGLPHQADLSKAAEIAVEAVAQGAKTPEKALKDLEVEWNRILSR